MKSMTKTNATFSLVVINFLAAFIFPILAVGQIDSTGSVYFGNGIRNGWADQTSIVVWTRSTKVANSNLSDGKKFLRPKGDALRKARQSKDPEFQRTVQIPDGAKLDEMIGACPGVESKIHLEYFETGKDDQVTKTAAKSALAKNDFAVQWKLESLKPGTSYTVRAVAEKDGKKYSTTGHFKTAPSTDTAKKSTRFCMTTCHDFPRRDAGKRGHKIYASMTKLKPDFTVHAGDIEYYDKPFPFAWSIELMRFKWNRFFALPDNRQFYSTHTTYFMKDDHDTLKNDCWPGQRYGSVTFEQGKNLFNREQFPSNDRPYKTIRWGRDLQIWLVEGRDFRSANNSPDGPEKTIWGKQQKKWFFESVKKSDATFKLLFSPTPILGPDRSNKNDNHSNKGFKTEGDELRKFIGQQKNLLVFCGDRHWQYASKFSDKNSTQTVWEFGCGPGSEKHQFGWKKGDKRPEHHFLRVAGGFLSGKLTRENNVIKLAIHHHRVDGRIVSTVNFEARDKHQK